MAVAVALLPCCEAVRGVVVQPATRAPMDREKTDSSLLSLSKTSDHHGAENAGGYFGRDSQSKFLALPLGGRVP